MKLSDYKDRYAALSYKKNLSGERALAEVEANGYALAYVKNQTEEICLAAVKEDGYALQFVKNQTEEICLAAVKEDGYALQFVNESFFTTKEFNDRSFDLIVNGKKYKLIEE